MINQFETADVSNSLDWISDQVSGVVDPVADRCRGWPAEQIQPVLAEAWRREFRCDLDKHAVSEAAAAIHEGRPWAYTLRTDGW